MHQTLIVLNTVSKHANLTQPYHAMIKSLKTYL